MALNTLQIIDPTRCAGWDEMLLRTPGYSFFHSSAWARVLSESYGYTPLYFTVIENDKFRALVPLMEVKSLLTGKRGVSLPFTDYCEPINNGSIQFQDLFEYITERGQERGWKYIELRGAESFLPDNSNSQIYFCHGLDLKEKEEEILANLRDSTKRNIKKAIKEGVSVDNSTSLEAIREFYELNCITRKNHGLPSQPYHFFENIHKHILSKNQGIVILASYKNRKIAGAIYFHFGKKATYKYGASDKNYQHLRANNLVMWEAIKWHCENGFEHFCFGRTEPRHHGLIQFKSGWGATERRISYYQYDFKKGGFISARSNRTGMHNKIFRKIPGPLLNWVGGFLYKHAG